MWILISIGVLTAGFIICYFLAKEIDKNPDLKQYFGPPREEGEE